jgi:chemotaxis protein CheC
VTPLSGTIGPREADALQELASIGCGQALTALGRLLHRRIDMDVPEAWVGRTSGALGDFLSGLGRDLVAVGVKLEGLLAGHLVLALPGPDAEELSALLGYPVPPGGPWPPLGESALLESGNIVGSAFVSAVAHLVHVKLLLSIPDLARGTGRTCLARLVGDVGEVALATRFAVAGPPALEGLILVMPEPRQLPGLLSALDSA